jgi:DNA 3'-phosphatase
MWARWLLGAGPMRLHLSLAALLTLVGAATAIAGCGAGEAPASAEDDLTSCDGARLDAAGSCRRGGKFAKKSCCAPRFAEERQSLERYTCPSDGEPIPVAFFDADNTLRVSRSGAVTANAVDDVIALPFAATKIAELNAAGTLVAIVSNQGGVAAGHTTLEVAEGALVFTAARLHELGATIDYLDFAEQNDEFRKPKTGMATRLAEVVEARCGVGIDLERSMMIGDGGYKKGVDGPHPDGRPADDFTNTDRLFAENLGVPFHEPTDAYGWKAFGVFNLADEAAVLDLLALVDAEIVRLREAGESPARRKLLENEVLANRRVNGF